MKELEVLSDAGKEHAEVLPQIRVPAALMVGSASKFTNIYAPEPETIYLQEELLAPEPATIRIGKGTTRSLKDYRPAGGGAAMRTALEALKGGKIARLGNQAVYDARWVFNGNLAHLMGHHVANLGYIKSKLGIDGNSITVILEMDSPQLSHDLLNLVGYETYETNRVVEGEVYEVEINPMINYHLVPYVHCLEPSGVVRSSLQKVFVSRRGGRTLTNEEDIIQITRNAGYETLYFEDLALLEQWGVIRDAGSIISIHGAALGYLSTKWKQSGTPPCDLLEIFSPGLVADCYRKIMAVLGGYWVGCRGHVSSEFVAGVEESSDYKSMDQKNFYLDPLALELAVNYITQPPHALSL